MTCFAALTLEVGFWSGVHLTGTTVRNTSHDWRFNFSIRKGDFEGTYGGIAYHFWDLYANNILIAKSFTGNSWRSAAIIAVNKQNPSCVDPVSPGQSCINGVVVDASVYGTPIATPEQLSGCGGSACNGHCIELIEAEQIDSLISDIQGIL